MIRTLTTLLFGLFFWLVFDFIFYAGLFVNYIKALGIPVYFNRFFVDHQVWWLWPVGTVIAGVLFMWESVRLKGTVLALMLAAAAVTWVPGWGEAIGYALFAQPEALYRFQDRTVSVERLYGDGREDFVRLPNKSYPVRYPAAHRLTAVTTPPAP